MSICNSRPTAEVQISTRMIRSTWSPRQALMVS